MKKREPHRSIRPLTSITRLAPAKINLALHVTGKRSDGYHLLDSLVVFADRGDVLTFEDAEELSLSVDGPFCEGVPTDERNLVLKVAKMLRPEGKGARIHLAKMLPHGGGIGGGSSDAATTARGLVDLGGIEAPTTETLLRIGADVPVCAHAPQSMFMRGIGEVLEPAPELPRLWCLLVNPMAHVPTKDVFKHLSDHHSTDNAPLAPMRSDFIAWLKEQRNDLRPSTCALVPVVGALLDTLRTTKALHSDMSGSGSTCWALFETLEAAEQTAALFHGTYWTLVTPIGG